MERQAFQEGAGFAHQPAAHGHWHIDVSYIKISGTFYYRCSVPDGCSRALVHRELRASMTEAEIKIVPERARKKHPGANPRIISDNGPRFVARDFQGIDPGRGHDAREDFAVLSAIERQIGRWYKSPKNASVPARRSRSRTPRG